MWAKVCQNPDLLDDDEKEEGGDLSLSLPTQVVKYDFIDVKMPHYCAHNKSEEADWEWRCANDLKIGKFHFFVVAPNLKGYRILNQVSQLWIYDNNTTGVFSIKSLSAIWAKIR